MTLRYGSVCSGIEAATVAWHPLGWTPVFFSEIERFPSEVLAHHYGSNLPGEEWARNGVPNYGDMTRYEEWPDADIDVLVGGTPCQDYSVAGLRLGMAGDRGQLTLTFVEIAARYRPRRVVWENVPGVLSSHDGRDFARFLGDLSGTVVTVPQGGWRNAGIVPGIADAYGLAWRVLDAQYVRVDGFGRAVPQRRRRVFVVGYLGDWRRAAAVLLEPESVSGNPAPRREPQGRVAGTLAGGARNRGGYSADDIPLAAQSFGGGRTVGPVDVAACLTAKGQRIDFEVETFVTTRDVAATLTRGAESGGQGGYAGRRQEDDHNIVAHTLRAEGFDASEDGTGRGIPLVPVAGAICRDSFAGGAGGRPEGAAAGHFVPVCFNSREDPEVTFDRAGALGASSPQAQAVAFQQQGSNVGDTGDVTGTLTKGNGNESGGVPCIADAWAVRRLTPTECERIQAFPDGYTRLPGRRGSWRALDETETVEELEALGLATRINRKGIAQVSDPDGPRYKALGNSMAVNVMRWIGRRIEMVDALADELSRESAL